jgi:hypothetical protein
MSHYNLFWLSSIAIDIDKAFVVSLMVMFRKERLIIASEILIPEVLLHAIAHSAFPTYRCLGSSGMTRNTLEHQFITPAIPSRIILENIHLIF